MELARINMFGALNRLLAYASSRHQSFCDIYHLTWIFPKKIAKGFSKAVSKSLLFYDKTILHDV